MDDTLDFEKWYTFEHGCGEEFSAYYEAKVIRHLFHAYTISSSGIYRDVGFLVHSYRAETLAGIEDALSSVMGFKILRCLSHLSSGKGYNIRFGIVPLVRLYLK